MVRIPVATAFLLVAVLVGAQDANATDKTGEKGPVLYGDGGGRIWKWTAGEKTWLTPEGRNLVLGGVGKEELWGWGIEGAQARFFTLELPKKKDQKADKSGTKDPPPPQPVFDSRLYPVPDRADRVTDRVLLVWGSRDGNPRYELWQAGQKIASQAWDDGRSVYALALGPEAGWILAGRTTDGLPWLELSGSPVLAPDGWRGRLTVAAWVPEKVDPKKDSTDSKNASPETKAKAAPPPVHPWAVGWGAPGAEPPRPLIWGPDGWTQPDPEAALGSPAGTYPLLGSGGDQGTLVMAGWQADEKTGTLLPWFWDGETASVPGGTAEGEPQAFSAGAKDGAFLVVRHPSPPWFTIENGKESVPVEGLDDGDRVVAVAPEEAKAAP